MRLFKRIQYFLSFPMELLYMRSNKETKALIDSDIAEMNRRCKTNNKGLLYWLVYRQPYRNLFYYRIPKAKRFRWLLPEYPLFSINVRDGIGKNAFVLNHPFATRLNAQKIGDNFTCCHLTTLGNGKHGRNDLVPTIGNNVSLGVNVTIVGKVTIGDNVTIGAGSVVVKDIPSNCVAVGNPARVVKYITEPAES